MLKKNLILNTLNVLFTKLSSIILFMVMARFVEPKYYGVMAIAVLVVTFSTVLVQLGLKNALIYFDDRYKMYSTVFTFNLVTMTVLFCAVLLSADFIVSFFELERLKEAIYISSSVIIIQSLYIVSLVKLEKKMDFKTITKVEIISFLLSAIVAISFAINEYPLYAVLFQLTTFEFFKMLLFNYFQKSNVRLELSIKRLKLIWDYGKYLIATRLLNFTTDNLDKVIVGKIADATTLGLFSRAFQLSSMPMSVSMSIINRVTLPYYSKHKNNIDYIKYRYLQIQKILMYGMFLFSFTLFAFADYIVLILLGDKWEGMIEYLQFFAFIILFGSFGVVNGPVFHALGKTKEFFYYHFKLKIVRISMIFVGAFWGVQGVLTALLFGGLINLLLAFIIIKRIINLTIFESLLNILKPFLITSIILVNSVFFKNYFFSEITIINFFVLMSSLCVSFFILLYFFDKSIIKSIKLKG